MADPLLLLAGLLGAVGLAVSFSDLRKGLFICVAVGFLQDPLRKITPGQPVALVMLVVVFAAATFIGAKARGVPMSVRRLNLWKTPTRRPIQIFLAIVVLASMGTLLRTGSVMLTGIGMLAYLAPIPAVLMASRFARREEDVVRFFQVYLIVSTVMVSGLYLSILGFEWKILGVVGEDLFLYTDEGAHRMLSGFFRASEIAAWHAGMSACAAVMLAVMGSKGKQVTAPMGMWICYFLGAVLLTSRRKILLEVIIFVLVYGFLLVHFRRGASQLVSRVLMVCIAFVFVVHALSGSERVLSSFNPYLTRGASTDGAERLLNTGQDLAWVVEANGIFGSGAGTGSQGAQHFGGGFERVGGSAESGPAKLLAELGIPGLLIAFWMVGSLARYLWGLMGRVGVESSSLVCGFVAFLVANAGVFFAYHQIFGDPFVLLILGFVLGFLLARDPVRRAAGTSQAFPVARPAPAHMLGQSSVQRPGRRIRLKLLIAATHPIQYHVPWFRALDRVPGVELEVVFGMIPDSSQQGVGFGVPFEWDIPMLEGYRWRVLPSGRRSPTLKGFFGNCSSQVEEMLAESRPDVVLVTGWQALPLIQILQAAARSGIPVIVRGDSNNLRKRPRLVRWGHRALLSMYDGCLAAGKANRAFFLENGVREDAIFDCRHFVDNDRFRDQHAALEPDRGVLRRRWSIPTNSFCFLFAGKLERKKHFLDLLDAFGAAFAVDAGIQLLVVGDGAERQEGERRALAAGLPVTFTGFLNQSEIASAYTMADCLVLPSDFGETWGLVVNEAMSCDLPAIVSDRVGCGPDLVEEGITGSVVPFGDREALTRKLLWFARHRDGARAMGRSAGERVRAYSLESAVAGTLAAARGVLSNRTGVSGA